MLKMINLITFFIIFSLSTVLFAAEFKIDPKHSHVGFKVRYMMLSSIKGQFKSFDGKAVLNENGEIDKINGIIDVNSIETFDKKRDAHLKSDAFFNADLYPSITFETVKIVKIDDSYIALGELNIHGISKKVSIPFKLSEKIVDVYGNERMGIEGAIRINRKEYGIMYSEKMDNGGLVVDDHVDLELNVQLIKQS
tara:strand:- start:846 stop:1430 length:585 start_codon:yes stop_codon:yes gene_type:complete